MKNVFTSDLESPSTLGTINSVAGKSIFLTLFGPLNKENAPLSESRLKIDLLYEWTC